MGIGTRRRAAARRRRVHHRQQQRRRRHHHHHHRTHHVTHIGNPVGLGLFRGRQQPRTQGNQAAVVTINTTTSSSSTGDNTRRLPVWCGSAVVTVILLTVSVVGLAVPAVPIPVGITALFMFMLIIVAPLVSNILRTRAARREGVVDDPEAPSPPTVTGGHTVVITELSTVDEASSANGPLGGVFNYDPPPSFNEAMAADCTSAVSPWLEGAQAQIPPGYLSTIGGTLQDPAYPPMGAPLKEEELPPPPSYDDVVREGNTYTPQ